MQTTFSHRRAMSALVTAEQLETKHLVALAKGRTLAVIVPNFCDADWCRHVGDRILEDHRLGGYQTEDGAGQIKKLGTPLFEVAGSDPARLEQYYATARASIRALRQLSRPFPYPMDRLRLTLQETWPAGAGFEMLHPGRIMNVGMPRVFESGVAALPHVDRLAWDVPDSAKARTLRAQWAANVYLRTAADGGELELWREAPVGEAYAALRLAGTYGLDRSRLGPPQAVIRPQVGDLILFNSNRIHAVRACRGGPRVTASCFIGFRGLRQPLTYWS